jgi:hypothetical protein
MRQAKGEDYWGDARRKRREAGRRTESRKRRKFGSKPLWGEDDSELPQFETRALPGLSEENHLSTETCYYYPRKDMHKQSPTQCGLV